ncbi:MAG: polysaccharide deacetylase family protein [Verrucomicrobiota bacterium]|nr:polysaccharide deacetylase family protein [Verrucomicrobiota bacterium]
MTATAATAFPLLAVAASEPLPLIVSLHDVAPSTRENCERMLTDLARHHLRVSSLLVVPNYHERGAAVDDRSFMQWLRDLEAAGHEIVIHGYFHRRPRRERETLAAKLITRRYTADEGEFYDLPYDEAYSRITRARDEFKAAGLTPRGFIAPAWLLSAEGERAAADAEMEYTTRLTNVRDLRTSETFRAQSLVYSVRSRWRRGASLAWNASLCRVMQNAPLVRIGLHPVDYDHAAVWRQILSTIDRLTDTREATTYRDWIAQQRIATIR